MYMRAVVLPRRLVVQVPVTPRKVSYYTGSRQAKRNFRDYMRLGLLTLSACLTSNSSDTQQSHNHYSQASIQRYSTLSDNEETSLCNIKPEAAQPVSTAVLPHWPHQAIASLGCIRRCVASRIRRLLTRDLHHLNPHKYLHA